MGYFGWFTKHIWHATISMNTTTPKHFTLIKPLNVAGSSSSCLRRHCVCARSSSQAKAENDRVPPKSRIFPALSAPSFLFHWLLMQIEQQLFLSDALQFLLTFNCCCEGIGNPPSMQGYVGVCQSISPGGARRKTLTSTMACLCSKKLGTIPPHCTLNRNPPLTLPPAKHLPVTSPQQQTNETANRTW